jgi:hypothetical protein
LFEQARSVGFDGETQYVVREAEAERAPEIAGEFYPNGDAACSDLAEASSPSNEEDEVIARICELTHRLGYNQAKTKMLLGQWARNLPGLQRKLMNEVDDQSGRVLLRHEDQSDNEEPKIETSQTSRTETSGQTASVSADESVLPVRGFLF